MMSIKTIWENVKDKKVGVCDFCEKRCNKQQYNYSTLCGNINYLRSYGENYYNTVREAFSKIKDLIHGKKIAVFSFGCGSCIDYPACREYLTDKTQYFPIDIERWPIRDADPYKTFSPKMPKELFSFDDGIKCLTDSVYTPVICFFNALHDILIFAKDGDINTSKLIEAIKPHSTIFLIVSFTPGKSGRVVDKNGAQLATSKAEILQINHIKSTLNDYFNFFEVFIDKKICVIKGEKLW